MSKPTSVTPSIVTLRLLVQWGVKSLFGSEQVNLYARLANTEVDYLQELGLTDTLLAIHRFMEHLHHDLGFQPCDSEGPMAQSVVALALKIGRLATDEELKMAENTWDELLEKKLVPVIFPREDCRRIGQWAKEQGYNTSSYLEQPIIKFGKLNIEIKPQICQNESL